MIRIFKTLLVRLKPRHKLSPVDLFRRDGWARKILRSVERKPPLTIVVLGGYLGDSTYAWMKRVPGSKAFVFEPVLGYAEVLRERFKGADVAIFNFGIGGTTSQRKVNVVGDATHLSSLDRNFPQSSGSHSEIVQFESFATLERLARGDIGVLEVNIEGGEYELITALSGSEFITRVESIFVQFHNVGEETNRLVRKARNELSQTHSQQWSYDMVWEHWTLLPR